jgi:hypothetical protein
MDPVEQSMVRRIAQYVGGLLLLSGALLLVRNSDAGGLAGSRAPALPGVEYDESVATVLIVIQIGCQFCENSMTFYRRLAERRAEWLVRFAVVMPDEREVAEEYLLERELSFRLVRVDRLSHLGVRGTPAILVVDPQGIVVSDYQGELSPREQESLLEKLGSIGGKS